MDRLRKARRPVRNNISTAVEDIEREVNKDNPDLRQLRILVQQLDEYVEKVVALDDQIMLAMIDDDCTDEEQDKENMETKEFRTNAISARLKAEEAWEPSVKTTMSVPSEIGSAYQGKRTYQLPKIEIKKFNGDLKDWLGFWSQFQKIHDDDELHDSDKFQYLIQATIQGSRARKLVESYPQTEKNYQKVVEALQDRFGDKTLLAEIYVRELLKFVNTGKSRGSSLSDMYDELETHLRSLESLGIKTEESAIFLYPMVESSLPVDIIKVWQRSPKSGYDATDEDGASKSANDRLVQLMKFLRQEVKGEERLTYVTEGVTDSNIQRSRNQGNKKKPVCEDEDVPTVAGLFVGEKAKCVFCDKPHASEKCFKVQKMTMDEKKAAVIEVRCCFLCLKPNHTARLCKEQVKCPKCSKKHSVIFCPEVKENKKTSNNGTEGSKPEVQKLSANLACSKVVLGTLAAQVHTAKSTVSLRSVTDPGAMKQYILNKVAKKQKLKKLRTEPLIHCLFSGVQSAIQDHDVYEVECLLADGKGSIKFEAHGKDQICEPLPRLPGGQWLEELKQHGIQLSDTGEGSEDIEMLLGAQVYAKILTGRMVKLNSGLTAIETTLGWTALGEFTQDAREQNRSIAKKVTSMLVTDATVDELWSLETIGIRDPADSKSKIEKEELAMKHFLETVTRADDGRYSVSLPWKEGRQAIPDNKNVAVKRLESATKKLQAMGYIKEYGEIFQAWLKDGIIEEVKVEDSDKPAFYLPHRAVLKPESATTPIRPVFDASCKSFRSPSLNDCLEKGPNLLDLIPSILLRFREGKIGAISDIKKAFLMIEVQQEDRDFLRFLWWEDSLEDTPTSANSQVRKMKVYRHKRVVFGVNCSPFLLGAVIEHHLKNVSENTRYVAEKLLKSFYVDNCVTSMDSDEEYELFKSIATEIMTNAQMDLRLWQRGSGEDTRVGSLNSSECGLVSAREDAESTSVLGIKWWLNSDLLSCDVSLEVLPDTITKRIVLSLVQKIFDPSGFLSPAMIIPKKIMQEAWSQKTNWDEEITDDLKLRFKTWYQDIESLKEIKIPRRFQRGDGRRENWQIHVFVDASQLAYAACIFLRCENGEEVTVQLLQAKSRVAPLKKITIPRLELLSCTIGARLLDAAKIALDLDGIPIFFWSDSTTALAWIYRNDDWGTFVGNRVKEILKLTRSGDWRHVPGKLNPADLPSRGCSPKQLLDSRWWEGPEWLKKSREDWPTQNFEVNEEEVNAEKKKSPAVALLVTYADTPWYVKRSSFNQNIRTVAWLKRFASFLRGDKSKKSYLSVEELKEAERTLIRLVQQEFKTWNKDVIEGIRVIRDVDDIIRVRTKLLNRDDAFGFKYPMLLPNAHQIVDQIIEEQHRIHGHGGVQLMMSKIREKFWILQGRKAIRKIVKRCVTCRRYSVRKMDAVPAALPADRVNSAKVFESVGVDLAGPLVLQDKKKVWILIITCAVYRCVHFELVDSISTENFLEAFFKFTNERGRPSVVFSDNGTNFVGANTVFKTLDWMRISKECGLHRIQWKFNPPSAAWWGGWWERLIRSMKDILKKTLGKGKVTEGKLRYHLSSAAAYMNERPLTTVTEDPDDLIPLTPAMFMSEIPVVSFNELDFLTARDFQTLYRERKSILDDLKMRFRREYLSLLVQRQKSNKTVEFRVGDVVLIGDDNKKRWEWPLARIIELMPGKDGHIRVVKLKTVSGIFIRPVQRVYPLEVSSAQDFPIFSNTGEKDRILAAQGGKKILMEDERLAAQGGKKLLPDETPTDSKDETHQEKEVEVKSTKFGRKVKTPDRLKY